MRPQRRKVKCLKDEEIIDLFFERSEQAITELSRKYGKVLMKIAMNALGSIPDAEECVNDAYLGLWNAIPPARPDPLLAFACRIVRNISINRYNSKLFSHKKNGYEECIDELENLLISKDSVEDEVNHRLVSEYIDDFLKKCNGIDQMIFVRRFWFFDTCENIAEEAGLSSNAVRKRLQRTKVKLKMFLKERGVDI